tara:strand:+ start:7731 stop:8036 length:306 start_codon:yes stop_codon:yes gene_type:complete
MPKGNWLEFGNPSPKEQPSSYCDIENKSNSRLRVEKTKAGKKGKTVTLISGLTFELDELKLLLKQLKTHCGTGGTVKEGIIELQGNHVDSVCKFLALKSFN